MAGPEMKNPAGGRGKWKGADGSFIPPYPCRLQAETGVRCCVFLGEVLFKEARHE